MNSRDRVTFSIRSKKHQLTATHVRLCCKFLSFVSFELILLLNVTTSLICSLQKLTERAVSVRGSSPPLSDMHVSGISQPRSNALARQYVFAELRCPRVPLGTVVGRAARPWPGSPAVRPSTRLSVRLPVRPSARAPSVRRRARLHRRQSRARSGWRVFGVVGRPDGARNTQDAVAEPVQRRNRADAEPALRRTRVTQSRCNGETELTRSRRRGEHE